MKQESDIAVTAMHMLQVPMDGTWTSSFAGRIKELRVRFGGKQAWLAHAIGCTDAAVSFWESGKRVPDPVTLYRIVDALNAAGASSSELLVLREHWHRARRRKSHGFGRPACKP
jgi:transcriptional regulator with XRE-family HTH domain